MSARYRLSRDPIGATVNIQLISRTTWRVNWNGLRALRSILWDPNRSSHSSQRLPASRHLDSRDPELSFPKRFTRRMGDRGSKRSKNAPLEGIERWHLDFVFVWFMLLACATSYARRRFPSCYAMMHHRYALNVSRHLAESEIMFIRDGHCYFNVQTYRSRALRCTISHLLCSRQSRTFSIKYVILNCCATKCIKRHCIKQIIFCNI